MNEKVRYFFGILANIEILGDYLGLIRQNELSMIEGSRNRLYVVDYGQNLMRMVQMMDQRICKFTSILGEICKYDECIWPCKRGFHLNYRRKNGGRFRETL